MTRTTYNIPNISCNHCVKTIEFELNDIPGVENVKADAETKTGHRPAGPPRLPPRDDRGGEGGEDRPRGRLQGVLGGGAEDREEVDRLRPALLPQEGGSVGGHARGVSGDRGVAEVEGGDGGAAPRGHPDAQAAPGLARDVRHEGACEEGEEGEDGGGEGCVRLPGGG